MFVLLSMLMSHASQHIFHFVFCFGKSDTAFLKASVIEKIISLRGFFVEKLPLSYSNESTHGLRRIHFLWFCHFDLSHIIGPPPDKLAQTQQLRQLFLKSFPVLRI